MRNKAIELLGSLQIHKNYIDDQRKMLVPHLINLELQYTAYHNSVEHAEKSSLEQLIPDVSKTTLSALLELLPNFPIPFVYDWFGLRKRLDPNVSPESLRLKLKEYLETLSRDVIFGKDVTPIPKIWEENVLSISSKFPDLPEGMRRLDERYVARVNAKINALENFLSVDLEQIDTELLSKLKHAFEIAETESKLGGFGLYTRSYRFPRKTNYSANNLSNGWLWWQLVSPESEFAQEVLRIKKNSKTLSSEP